MATAVEDPKADAIESQSVGYDPNDLAQSPGADDKTYSSDPKTSDYAWDDVGVDDLAGDGAGAKPSAEAPTETIETVEDPFDGELLSAARDLGFSDDEARAFGTPQNLVKGLQRVIDVTERQEKPAPDARKAPDKPIEVPEFDLKSILLNPEKIDPELAATVNAAFEKIHGHYTGKVGFLEKALGQLGLEFKNTRESAMQAEAQAFERRFHGYVKELPEPYRAELGADLPEVKQGSKQWNAQVRVVETMSDLKKTRLGAGKSEPELAAMAAQFLFGDKAKTSARQEIVTKLKERGKQAIGGTAQRNGTPVSGMHAAIKTVERFQRQIGAMPV